MSDSKGMSWLDRQMEKDQGTKTAVGNLAKKKRSKEAKNTCVMVSWGSSLASLSLATSAPIGRLKRCGVTCVEMQVLHPTGSAPDSPRSPTRKLRALKYLER